MSCDENDSTVAVMAAVYLITSVVVVTLQIVTHTSALVVTVQLAANALVVNTISY